MHRQEQLNGDLFSRQSALYVTMSNLCVSNTVINMLEYWGLSDHRTKQQIQRAGASTTENKQTGKCYHR